MSLDKLLREIEQRKERARRLYPSFMGGEEKAQAISESALGSQGNDLIDAIAYEIFLFEYYLLQLKKTKKWSTQLEQEKIAKEEKAIYETLDCLSKPSQYDRPDDDPTKIIARLSKRANYVLIYAAQKSDDALFDAALSAGADANFKYQDTCALSDAAKNKNSRMVEALIKAGAVPERLMGGIRPAEYSRKKEDPEIAKCIAARDKAQPELDRLFNALKAKIGQVGHHSLAKAKEAASRLLANLEVAKGVYEENVEKHPRSFKDSSSLFLRKCKAAIGKEKLILERDLGWGVYLQNFLKSIVNAFLTLASCGYRPNLFQKQRATAAMEVEAFYSQLENNVFKSF